MKTISIIGSGSMAQAIGTRIARSGDTVEVLSRDPVKAKAFAVQLGPNAKIGAYAKSITGDIVILAVPYGSAKAVVQEFGSLLAGKILIDITNPVNSDMTGLVSPAGSSGAQEISASAPPATHVVKAFNSLFGHVLARGERLDAFFAADDPAVKIQVKALLESMNLRPLDVGGLHMAQTLESVGLMMIGLAKNGAASWDIALTVRT